METKITHHALIKVSVLQMMKLDAIRWIMETKITHHALMKLPESSRR